MQKTANYNGETLPREYQHSTVTATVVVCTRSRPASLRQCLQSIACLEPGPDEVIVVDNTAGDKATESLALEFLARYTIEPIPGLSRARNRGIVESKSEIVAYLDDDAVPDKHWLGYLLAPFAAPSIAVVTGETILPGSSAGDDIREPIRFLSNKDCHWFEAAAYGTLGIGTNMALRRAACLGRKVFDERLGRGAPLHGMEEHHAFVRLLSLSYCAAHVPAAIVVHPFIRRISIEEEVSHAIAYWLLLFLESPGHRLDLISFLCRRLGHKPVTWQRNSPPLGLIVTSGWRVRIKAVLSGALLYIRTKELIGR